MSPRGIRLVCLDLGGVVVRVCRSWAEGCAAAGVACPPSLDGPKFHARLRALDELYQLGRLDNPRYIRAVSDASVGLVRPEEASRIEDAWLLGEYPEMDAVVGALNALPGVETACLSNTNPRHWTLMEADEPIPRFPAFRQLAHRQASHLLGLAKPSPEIYREFERRTGFRGGEILFFDDRVENVQAARELGWQSATVDSEGNTAAQIRSTLTRLGVL